MTADGARLATTIAEVSAATLEPVTQGEPYLALPVGRWAQELRLEASRGGSMIRTDAPDPGMVTGDRVGQGRRGRRSGSMT